MSTTKKLNPAAALKVALVLTKHYFGSKTRKLKPMIGGRTNHVFETTSPNGPVIIRLSDNADSLGGFMKEQWATARAGEAGVPVTEILEVGNIVVPYPYMIQRKVTGTAALHYTDDNTDIVRQMGAMASHIHSIRTKGFGDVFDWSENMLSKNGSFKQYMEDDMNVRHRLSVLRKHGGLSDKALRNVAAAVRNLAGWKGMPSLAHGDIRLKNVMVDDQGSIVALIDWEECHSGPAMIWDLAISLHDLGIDKKQAFIEGYGIKPKEFAEHSRMIKALNILHYASTLERAAAKKDKQRVSFLQLRLGGSLDLFAV
jgi:aminoglycoside phosphotransferase (APT) family kinase protein